MLIKAYLMDRKHIMVLLIMIQSIYAITLFLYQVNLEIFVYCEILVITLILFSMIYDFSKYLRQHKAMVSLQNQDNNFLSLDIDDPTLKGKDYQDLLKIIEENRQNLISNHQAKEKDTQDYFSMWVHQIKLPIAAMKLLLEDEQIDKQECKYQLFRIDQYVGMVLTYLRSQSQQTDYVFKSIDLDTNIQQVIRRFSFIFIRKKIQLTFTKCHSHWISDEKWFQFIIEQILSNALKYTHGNGHIQIYMKDDDTLCIQDDGIGIESSDIHRIFEKGYTGLNGRYDQKASGIGLYLTKQIATNLNLLLEIKSQKGKGTIVTIQENK